jgi:pimeloyl-ACP methyl ester carboxylesterase
MLPETRYARLRSERIAYQVLGDVPRDLVLTTGSFSNGDVEWEDATMARLLMRLASFARVIRFDRRGTGASDPVRIQALPPWESYVEELVAVMDTVGSEVATVMAVFDAGPMGMVFAATKPERTAGLVLANTAARFLWAADHRFGTPREVADQLIDQVTERWGTEALVWIAVPSRAADERYRRWHARLQRSMASPGAVEAYLRALFDMDAREVLRSIHVPTLVLHRKGLALVPLEQGRYLAQHISDAVLVELDGTDLSLAHQGGDELVGRIEEFMTGERRGGRARTACSPRCCSATSSVPPCLRVAWATSMVAALGFPMARLWRQERAARVAAAGADRADLPPEQHFPVPLIGLHGLLALTTLVLVRLVALGVGD